MEINDNNELNTRTMVWLDFGKVEEDRESRKLTYHHDIDFDCGADTFEYAIIKLAKLVKTKLERSDR